MYDEGEHEHCPHFAQLERSRTYAGHLRAEVGSTDHTDSFFTCPVESRARDAPMAGQRARAQTGRCPLRVTIRKDKNRQKDKTDRQ